jgi:hypothetical protein
MLRNEPGRLSAARIPNANNGKLEIDGPHPATVLGRFEKFEPLSKSW